MPRTAEICQLQLQTVIFQQHGLRDKFFTRVALNLYVSCRILSNNFKLQRNVRVLLKVFSRGYKNYFICDSFIQL